MDDNTEEKISFLHSKPFESKEDLERVKDTFWKTNWAIQAVLILLYTAVSITMILSFHSPQSERTQNAIPNLHVKYTQTRFTLMRDTPYIGQPTPSVDDAWSKLLANMSIRVSDSELNRQSATSMPLPHGGNLAWLGVFHELHCIKMLRKANYREHYHPGAKGQELRDLQVHVDHCIELLRASAMCRPDLETLTTFKWRAGLSKPLLSPERPLRRCVAWDVLMGSLEERVVGDEEMNELENPLRITVPDV